MAYVVPPILDDFDETRDIHREIRDALVDRFGYTHRRQGRFTLEVDSEHSAVLVVGPNFGERRTNEARIWLGVMRRDINDLWRELLSKSLSEWFPTINNSEPYFFGEADPNFSHLFHTPEVIQEWLDAYIPRLASELCNYRFVSQRIDEYARNGVPAAGHPGRLQLFVTALLDGWTDEAEEEFLAPMVAQLDEDWRDDPDGSIRQGRIDRVRAWIAEHPDGVERQLTD